MVVLAIVAVGELVAFDVAPDDVVEVDADAVPVAGAVLVAVVGVVFAVVCDVPGEAVVGGGVASGSVYWLSPADGPESASALATGCTLTVARTVTSAVTTRRERMGRVSHPRPFQGRIPVHKRCNQDVDSVACEQRATSHPVRPRKPGYAILQDLLQSRIGSQHRDEACYGGSRTAPEAVRYRQQRSVRSVVASFSALDRAL